MAKRIESQAVSYKTTQQINAIADQFNEFVKNINVGRFTVNDFIKSFNEINTLYISSKKDLDRSIQLSQDTFNSMSQNYLTKEEQDSRYLNKSSLTNVVLKNGNFQTNNKLTINGNNKIIANKNGNILMTLNGVKLIAEGEWLKFINPDNSELYAHNINTNNERMLGRDVFRLSGEQQIDGNWNELANSRIENVNGSVNLPDDWNDLIIIVDNTKQNYGDDSGSSKDFENAHKYAPSYVFVCRAEVPIKFLTPFSVAGIEVGATYVRLTQKTGPVFMEYSKSRDYGRIVKVLWR